MSNSNVTDLGYAKLNAKKPEHIPSKIQADTLFTFTSKLEYLIPELQLGMISPRYCVEDISYLKITGIKELAYPMKCFCDINLHRLGEHLEWYGYYGIAFSKGWGMANGIQPIQYINPDSGLRNSFSAAFKAALRSDSKKETVHQTELKDFIFHEMMFYKPYAGKMSNRITKKKHTKCFTDECEWRYIPEVTTIGFEQAYFDDEIIHSDTLRKFSDALAGDERVSIKYSYSDIKYIIVKTREDFAELVKVIEGISEEDAVKNELISKTIIWDYSKGDF